jgi:hypothetical protein
MDHLDMITVQYERDGSIELVCGIDGCGCLWTEVSLRAERGGWPSVAQLVRGATAHVREAHARRACDLSPTCLHDYPPRRHDA